MKKGIAKCTAFVLAAGLVIGEGGSVMLAAGTDSVLVGLGSSSYTPEETSDASASSDASADDTGADTYYETESYSSAYSSDTVLVGLSADYTSLTAETEPETETEIADETAAAEDAAIENTFSEDAAPEQEAVTITPAAEASETEAPAEDNSQNKAAKKKNRKNKNKETEAQTEPLDTSMVGTTGFAQCEEYLNVRSGASIDAEPVGKIYNNGSLAILDVTADGWYHVRSGNVEGYVSSDFVAIGDEASQIAADTGYTTAEVGAEVLNVRSSATTDSDIIATIDNTNVIEVVEDQGDWVKVILDGEMYGYVSADYVATTTEYATGETLEEEQERLDREWLAYLAEQEAARQAAEAAYLAAIAQEQAQATVAYTDASYTQDTSYTYTESYDNSGSADTGYTAQAVDTTADAAAQATTAYQNYLDAQEAADAAVANGADEQTIIDTASDAQAAYASYLTYQNAADEAAAGMTADTSTSQAAPAETTAAYTETASATDTAAYETTDTSSTDTSYTETAQTYTEDTSSYSSYSTGEAIANYACQFVGNPYVYGGSSLTGGADCSGFTMSVLSNFGVSLPHNAAAQSGYGTAVSMDNLQPGDLLFYEGDGGIGHVSIYIGNGQVVHASNPTNGILISSIGYRTPCAARRMV